MFASLLRVPVIALACMAFARRPDAHAGDFFRVIAAWLVMQGMVTGAAIRLGAPTHGLQRSTRQRLPG